MNDRRMFTIHATRTLLDRVKRPSEVAVEEPATELGNWYATASFWKRRQVALLVSERTLLPVFVPLAPASSLMKRFPSRLAQVLERLDVPPEFILHEVAAMADGGYAKTANRSVVGSMNDFMFLASFSRRRGNADDLLALSRRMARTPCGPLRKSHGFPDRELYALVEVWMDR